MSVSHTNQTSNLASGLEIPRFLRPPAAVASILVPVAALLGDLTSLLWCDAAKSSTELNHQPMVSDNHVDSDRTRLIDASTAHRLSEGWVYGLPELAPGQRAAIREARYVSNAGCYATALLLAVRPLVDGGLLPRSVRLSLSALSGYSGGGRPMIERWEDPERGFLMLPYTAPYALERIHKHVPEMQTYAGLEEAPLFMPSVGPFRTGMRMLIPLHAETLPAEASPKAIWEALHSRYDGEPFVRVLPLQVPLESDESSFDPRACNGTNRLEIVVAANPAGHVVLIVLLDNLGKGAAGVAVQNLNLMLGLPEAQGLRA